MKRSTFLSTIAAALAAFFGFKNKATKSYHTYTYSNQSGDTWTDQGLFVQECSLGYTNEKTFFVMNSSIIEFSAIDWDCRKYVVQRSEDSGQTWTTVREYDLENLRA